jgi:hypothetical protein
VLTPRNLASIVRAGAGTETLTVYLDARVTDPAMRHAWRPALLAAVRAERARLADDRARADFDRAAALLEEPTPVPGGVWGAPGWVAFLTPDGPLYADHVPVQVPTLAVWRDGPFVSPYLRVLKQHRPVIVALVDSRSARFFRYAWGAATALPDRTLTVHEELGPTPAGVSELRARSTPAPRGALGTERASRRRLALFRRLAALLGARVAELAGRDAWIVIGGTPEWAHLAGEALSPRFPGRLAVSASLDRDATEGAVARAANDAASALRAAHGRALLDWLLERALPQGRGEAGVPATQRALHAQAVDLLLLSPELLRRHPHEAEDAVRAALAQGADVEVLSGEAGEQLDRVAGGVAARLRFAIDGPPLRRSRGVASGVRAGAERTPAGERAWIAR